MDVIINSLSQTRELKLGEVNILTQCLLGNNKTRKRGFLIRKFRDLFTTLKLPCEMQERENINELKKIPKHSRE